MEFFYHIDFYDFDNFSPLDFEKMGCKRGMVLGYNIYALFIFGNIHLELSCVQKTV